MSNRIIKFRAWDNVNKRMLGPFGPFCRLGEYDLLYLDGHLDVPAEDNLEFMQFIGIKDKDNIDIYEGDIVEYRMRGGISADPNIYIDCIKLSKTCCGHELNDDIIINSWNYLYHTFEIIGNIFQNPDLLNK